MESAAEAKKLKGMSEKLRVYQFQLGLNQDYDQACDLVLGGDPFPTMDEAFTHDADSDNRILVDKDNCGVIFSTSLEILDLCWKLHGQPENKKGTGSKGDLMQSRVTSKPGCSYCSSTTGHKIP
ncbi:hypothetical protein Nepgr_030760 [Nepenthes gracilis]|uniref:Uncharacterized protein n=1 Tax=Nepenthes gracilis TaxID=150966 RepID=A0AAD3Y444_NEPGR|nr:hypothetical protein Nepgr_030760 [Nepenthes gracilis]